MSGLISLLIFAAFFFLMMRFGCGAHAGHGGHHRGHRTESSTNTDPVCGMQVEPDQGYAKVYQGTRYRFCSRDCLDKFDAAPDKYTGSSNDAHAGHHS
jgi:YHS domain-containing protein